MHDTVTAAKTRTGPITISFFRRALYRHGRGFMVITRCRLRDVTVLSRRAVSAAGPAAADRPRELQTTKDDADRRQRAKQYYKTTLGGPVITLNRRVDESRQRTNVAL